ncbi:TPA: restriction endonuclease subunit S [Streptococcus suis]
MTRMKDSGNPWVREIPSDWFEKKLRYLVKLRGEKSVTTDYKKYVGLENIMSQTGEYVQTGIEVDLTENLTFEVGDILFGKLRPYLRKYWRAEFSGTASSEFVIIKGSSLNLNFLFWAIQSDSFINDVDSSTYGSKMPRASWEYMKNIKLPFPESIEEQAKIADFLDKKVAQLDKVKSLLEEQIKTLEDYRQSLIYETVTKGLDKTVPLKDSGVDWIGQIPIANSLKKLKYLLATPLQYGANESGEDYDESLPRYIRITDIDSNGDLKREGKQSLAEKIATPYILQDGDLLFARSGATVGKTFLYKSCFGRSAFAGYLIKASLNKSLVLPKYLYYYTLSPLFNTWKEMTFIQSTIQNIGADRYNILPVLIYPIEEQQKMIDYLDCKISQINQMILIKKEQIENINKQRQTLIYDYVTGKRRV